MEELHSKETKVEADSGFRTKGLKLPRISTSLSPKCSPLQMKGYSGCFWKLNDELMIAGGKIHFTSVLSKLKEHKVQYI